MVISGMNRYFARHGRWVFGIIAIVVSVAFVGYFSRISLMDLIRHRGRSHTLSLLGRTVTMEDRRAELNKTLILAAMRNPTFDIKRANLPISSQQLVTQLLLSYAADDMGIAISDAAVSKFIKKTPSFQTDGKFDMKKYAEFVKNKLTPANLTKRDMDDAVRGQLKVEALQKCVIDNVIISDDEIKDAYKNLNGKVDAKRLRFQAAKFADKIKYTEKEIHDYFEAHKLEYRTAPAAKGLVVAFEYAGFQAEAAKRVTLADIEKYYNDHKFLYVKKTMAKPSLKKKDAKTEYEPLAKVSAKIRKIQVEAKAKELAFAAAQTFSDKLYNRTVDVFYDEPDKVAAMAKCAKIFADSAKTAKGKTQSTGWLSEGVAATGLQSEKPLVSTMNKLQADNPLSEPVKGSKGVYVALLEGKRRPKLETLKQAEKRVKASYLKEKSLSLARETARNTALKISEELAKHTKLVDIEKKLHLKFEDFQVTPYSRISPAESKAAFGTAVGKLSHVVPTPYGAEVLYVAAKPEPTMKEYDKQKKFFAMRYKMMKRNSIFRSYVDSLMKASKLVEDQK